MLERTTPNEWLHSTDLAPLQWQCGYCGDTVGSSRGYRHKNTRLKIYVCGSCGWPTAVHSGRTFPSAKWGRSIEQLPADLNGMYEEARACVTTNSHTAVVLLCRVLLLRVAKDKGIAGSPSFVQCIEHLVDEGWIGGKDKDWVDKIRVFGNQANHELGDVTEEDAKHALRFVEHMLASMYEFREFAQV